MYASTTSLTHSTVEGADSELHLLGPQSTAALKVAGLVYAYAYTAPNTTGIILVFDPAVVDPVSDFTTAKDAVERAVWAIYAGYLQRPTQFDVSASGTITWVPKGEFDETISDIVTKLLAPSVYDTALAALVRSPTASTIGGHQAVDPESPLGHVSIICLNYPGVQLDIQESIWRADVLHEYRVQGISVLTEPVLTGTPTTHPVIMGLVTFLETSNQADIINCCDRLISAANVNMPHDQQLVVDHETSPPVIAEYAVTPGVADWEQAETFGGELITMMLAVAYRSGLFAEGSRLPDEMAASVASRIAEAEFRPDSALPTSGAPCLCGSGSRFEVCHGPGSVRHKWTKKLRWSKHS